jgi:folate-binding protein YgfZ
MTDFMNTWLQFLTQQGAQLQATGAPEVTGFDHNGTQPSPATGSSGFVAPLTDLGLIAVTGEEAATFLHNQLTNDVEHLGSAEARLAGYCTAKGRLLATMLMWKSGDAVMLQLPRQIQPAVQKRLQMFVLRTKAKLADATDNFVALGLSGEPASAALTQWFPTLPASPYSKVQTDAGTLIRMPNASGAPRYQWITSVDAAQDAWPILTKALSPVGTHLWRVAEINAGIPQITQPTQEQFVPQMVNFELIGGVNFKKGCYPGQEIVARSQYLGKLKRRMVLASVDVQDARAGIEVFASTDPEQPCGMIVNAERNATGSVDCLVEVKLAALENGTIHLGSADGAVLKFNPMPYPFPDAA